MLPTIQNQDASSQDEQEASYGIHDLVEPIRKHHGRLGPPPPTPRRGLLLHALAPPFELAAVRTAYVVHLGYLAPAVVTHRAPGPRSSRRRGWRLERGRAATARDSCCARTCFFFP